MEESGGEWRRGENKNEEMRRGENKREENKIEEKGPRDVDKQSIDDEQNDAHG